MSAAGQHHDEGTEVDKTSVLFPDPEDLEPTQAEVGEQLVFVADASGERLDKWLAVQLPDRSRAEIQRWIEAGLVVQGAKTLKASYRVTAGETVEVTAPAPEEYAVEPEDIPLAVLYEDADLLVIDKPAGMVVHPGAGNWHGTLVNAVLHHAPDLAGVGGTHRPGIVHRLDKDTSGLILVAKNDKAQRALQAQFQARQVRKTYLALVYGLLEPAQGEINAPVGRDTRDRKRMAVVSTAHGRIAVTRYVTFSVYRVPGGGERLSLLECHPETGRTHQIRVHLAHINHPIVGDQLYSPRRRPPIACPRQFLHAHRLRFRLPSTGVEVEFSASLPADLQAVLDRLTV
jgi:23S rRNA pseudouridine1911/1915/1917 synthase